MNVPKPAAVALPPEVKRLLIVDKTEGSFLVSIEGLLGGGIPAIDRTLSQECMSGLNQPFLQYGTVSIVRHDQRLRSENRASAGFGNVMSANQIQELAKLHQADALMVIEYFNTNFTIRSTPIKDKPGAFNFRAFAQANAGIRVYLPSSNSLFYENNYSFGQAYGQTTTNKAELIGQVALALNALKFVSYELGKSIGTRFVSYRVWENREINRGKTPAGKRAERLILAQDYRNAIKTLEAEFNHEPKLKKKAKIAHNLGYCYEVLGDLPKAKEWLTEAFVISGKNRTRLYLEAINRRITEQQLIEMQQGGN